MEFCTLINFGNQALFSELKTFSVHPFIGLMFLCPNRTTDEQITDKQRK